MTNPRSYQPYTFCSFCAQPFAPEQLWPRRCTHCGNTTYRNPLPVAVVLVPIDRGLLVVRRSIPPRSGLLALPGGFINHGEGWREAGAREVEEAGLRIDPATIREFAVRSAPDSTLLVFGLAAPLRSTDLPLFTPTAEASERLVLAGPAELAFPLHTEVAARYFAQAAP